MNPLRYLKLNSGDLMPTIGLGTYMLQGSQGRETIDKAIFLGYRSLDTALSYGNERDIGFVIKDREQTGKVKRKDLFLTTKVPSVYLERNDVYRSIQESLENLKTKYLDLILIHHPWGLVNRGDGTMRPTDKEGRLQFQQYDLVESWKGMEQAQKDGLVRAIGISNFTKRQIERILNQCKIRPANLQLECHAYLQQRNLHEFCNKSGITLTAYSPLGAPGRPEQHRLPDHAELLTDPLINDLSKQYNKTRGNILLRWLIQRGLAVVPKATSEERLKENFDIFDFQITEADMELIRSLDRGVKYFHFKHYKGHPDFEEGEGF